jgi:hypothetical protein
MTDAFCGDQYVTLEKGTPVFARPDVTLTPLVATMRKMKAKVYGKEQFFLQNPVHLSLVFRFYKIQMAPNKYAWVSPDIKLVKNPKTGRLQNTVRKNNPLWRIILLGIIICGLIAVCFIYFCSLLKREGQPVLILKPWQKTFCGISFIVLLRWLFLLIIIIGGYNITLFSTDEPDFYHIAADMYQFGVSGLWKRSIGQAVFYLPFIAALKTASVYDIIIPYSWFSGFVMMPSTFVLFFYIVLKLTESRCKAFAATFLFAVVPLFFFHFERLDEGLIKSFFAFPASFISFRYYKSLIWTGFNAMSDVSSMFLIMLGIMLALYMKPRLRLIALVAMVFAFACLVRINNIFFAPLIGWLFWFRFRDELCNVKFLGIALITALGCFVTVFLPQLLVNHFQFGSFMTFPYVAYEKTSDGFEWAMLSTNVPLLLKANWPFFVLGLLGVFSLKQAKQRITYVLWIVPEVIFFLGYVFSKDDTTRFIFPVYGALFAACVCSQVWDGLSRREMGSLIVMLALSILLVCPSDYTWAIQYPWDLQQYSWGKGVASGLNYAIPAIAALITLSFFRNRGLMLFSATFMMLYFSGAPWIFPPLFVAALAWAVCDWGKDIYLSFRTAKAPIALK